MRKYQKTLYATSANIPMPRGLGKVEDMFNLVNYYLHQSDILKVNVTIIEYGDSTYQKYLIYISGDDKMKRWLETFTSIHVRESVYQIDIYNSKERVNKFMEERAGEFI